jgi:hypothetical protein
MSSGLDIDGCEGSRDQVALSGRCLRLRRGRRIRGGGGPVPLVIDGRGVDGYGDISGDVGSWA